MKKRMALVLLAILATVPCFADNSKIEIRGSADDGESQVMSSGLITKYFASGVIQQQTISLDSNSFTALTIPTGAKAIMIDVISSDGLILKGVTADTGISLDKTCPVLMPLTSDSSIRIGIRNNENNSNRAKVYFF